ncbi:hypothetical protein [Hamadaea tsunoensis]|uniref:hypothetical protein n=1 Tax=Hamadaea tsunoensis TaxID=53368 RepID=UPI001FE16CE0|nr:hypothetical protein [Hamadaea tsunoensis]
MNRITRLWTALAAAFLSVFALPGMAFAASDSGAQVLRRGFGGACSIVCCLVVVAAIVGAVVFISRRRKS